MRNILWSYPYTGTRKTFFCCWELNKQLVDPVPWIIKTCFHFHNYISFINFTSLKSPPPSWVSYNIIRRFIEYLVTCAVVKKTQCLGRKAVSGCVKETCFKVPCSSPNDAASWTVQLIVNWHTGHVIVCHYTSRRYLSVYIIF